jgi:hypothetical protein
MAIQKKEQPKDEPELYPDAWDRLRQAVHVMAKAGPQHRIANAAVKSGQKHKRGASDSSHQKNQRSTDQPKA